MTTNLSPFTDLVKAGFAKIAPWWLARRDAFVAKVPGMVTGVTSPPALSAHTRNR